MPENCWGNVCVHYNFFSTKGLCMCLKHFYVAKGAAPLVPQRNFVNSHHMCIVQSFFFFFLLMSYVLNEHS